MRRGLTNCLTRVSLWALVATALMCVASVSIASAQAPSGPPAGFPFIPQEDFDAPPMGEMPPPTSTTPPVPEEVPAPPAPVPVLPPATPDAPKLMGSTVGWSRRTLSVTVSCGASGTVSVLRHGRRIGRSSFACPASGAARVRVRITAAAARRLRVGTPVRVKVRTGAQRDTKRMRVARAVPAQASSNHCTSWFISSTVAWAWQSSSSWWEFWCAYQGFQGGHLADWWEFYYFSYATNYQEYYGTWTRYHGDGCWYYWHAPNLSQYGPYCS